MKQSIWAVVEDFDGDESLGLFIKDGNKVIASMPGIGVLDFDAARLIAAAPGLLAAMQAIIDEAGDAFGHQQGPGTINRMAFFARAAIAKATGEAP